MKRVLTVNQHPIIYMTNNHRGEGELFEDEVRRIARELWPSAQYSGASIIDGRERDGIFETEDCINIVEATISPKKDKAEYDGEKLSELARDWKKRAQDKAIRCFFITKHEPTPQQRDVLKKAKYPINPLSYRQFQQKLVNASDYLELREKFPFGSARDPETDDIHPKSGYIGLDLLDQTSLAPWSLEKVKNHLLAGDRAVLLGDYGAGKSMTLREIFKLLKSDFYKSLTEKFPIYINLRDHQGQSDPAEVILRHATRIGFRNPDHLIRAWRAGFVVLLLDGFDEIGTLGWTGQWKKLRELRHRAMEVVRHFNRDAPRKTGVIVAGRAHFFDSDRERTTALGLGDRCIQLTLSDFSEEQIEAYLKRFGITTALPNWLPTRPLLLGYLASKNLIGELTNGDKSNDAASGWDLLLDRVVSREARIEVGIDGHTLRRIVERIATKARCSPGGLGPVFQKDLSDAFFEICGYQPNESAMVLLQRLPGLGVRSGADEARVFIHEDLTDVCRAGDLFVFVTDPFTFPLSPLENWEAAMGEIGQQVLVRRLNQNGVSRGKLEAPIRILETREKCTVAVADLVLAGINNEMSFANAVFVSRALIPFLDLSEVTGNHSEVNFQECLFSELCVASEDQSLLPRFLGCYIGNLSGRVSRKDLPQGIFDEDCTFDCFEGHTLTTSSIMELSLPLGQRVLLSVLKKLYVQKGSGRRENALLRGLDERSRRIVPDILRVLKANGLTYVARHAANHVFYPVRSQTKRVYQIINAPSASQDILLNQVAGIES